MDFRYKPRETPAKSSSKGLQSCCLQLFFKKVWVGGKRRNSFTAKPASHGEPLLAVFTLLRISAPHSLQSYGSPGHTSLDMIPRGAGGSRIVMIPAQRASPDLANKGLNIIEIRTCVTSEPRQTCRLSVYPSRSALGGICFVAFVLSSARLSFSNGAHCFGFVLHEGYRTTAVGVVH